MKNECPSQIKCAFLGVFLLGLVLVGVTANYYLNMEAQVDREARNRRIAAEVARFRK